MVTTRGTEYDWFQPINKSGLIKSLLIEMEAEIADIGQARFALSNVNNV